MSEQPHPAARSYRRLARAARGFNWAHGIRGRLDAQGGFLGLLGGCAKQAASIEPVPQAANRVKDAARRFAVAFGDP